jgi:hypothetical protein
LKREKYNQQICDGTTFLYKIIFNKIEKVVEADRQLQFFLYFNLFSQICELLHLNQAINHPGLAGPSLTAYN